MGFESPPPCCDAASLCFAGAKLRRPPALLRNCSKGGPGWRKTRCGDLLIVLVLFFVPKVLTQTSWTGAVEAESFAFPAAACELYGEAFRLGAWEVQ